MLNRLPPPLEIFLRQIFVIAVGWLALTGALAIYDGHAKPPRGGVAVGLVLGCALYALIRSDRRRGSLQVDRSEATGS